MVTSLNGHRETSEASLGFGMPEAETLTLRLTHGDCPAHPGGRACAGPKYAGAVIVMRANPSVEEALRWDHWRQQGDVISFESTDPTQVNFFDDLQRVARRYLIGWNLRERRLADGVPDTVDADGVPSPSWQADENGTPIWFPVPATVEDLMRQPLDFAKELYWRFWAEVAGLRDPLSTPPSAGPPSQAPSTPQPESQSAAPESLETP